MSNITIIKIDNRDIYHFECPHCSGLIEVESSNVNCGIFRHAIFKDTHDFVQPHSTEIECESYINNNSVYGCCKPFKIENMQAVICDYI